jgi:predicted O-methyltransferase YrrM
MKYTFVDKLNDQKYEPVLPPQRYGYLINLVKQYKPKTICEIGTNKGKRAFQMINAASEFNENIVYDGYDLFEESPETESNGKGFDSVDNVRSKIVSSTWRKATINLTKGDTKKVFTEPKKYDFVWLDGGHNIDTVEHDYNMVKESKVVVFDDYYMPDENGKILDIENVGCNKLIDKLTDKKVRIVNLVEELGRYDYVYLPTSNGYEKMGMLTLVVVENEYN